jgi:hypothetical protein
MVKMIESLITFLLQDLKATCEEQRGSNSMNSTTTEVGNFGHCQLSEVYFMYRTRRLDVWLFPNLQEIGTFWIGGRVECSVYCRLGPDGLETPEIACICWKLYPSSSSLQAVASLL